MSPERHAEIKKTFTVAAELTGPRRSAYLDEACEDDPELRAEVESLLVHHDTQTLIQDVPRHLLPQEGGSRLDRGGLLATQFVGTTYRRALTLAVGGALILGLGVWVHRALAESLEEMRGEELAAILNASTTTLELWISERLRDARGLAESDQLRALIEQSSRARNEGRDAELEALATRFRALTLDHLRDIRPHEVIVVDRRGRLIHDSGDPSFAGTSLREPRAYSYLLAALEGRTVFAPPFRADELSNATDSPEERARRIDRVWFLAPIFDGQRNVIAVIAFSKLAEDELAAIFENGRLRETLETYAFDGELRMLSNSRFGVRASSRAKTSTQTAGRSAIRIVDPGLDRATTLAEQALLLASKGRHSGRVMKPYTSYRGTQVVGAWRWLERDRIVIATEIEASEAFRPLNWLDQIFGLLFGVLLIASASSFLSAISIVRLRDRALEGQLGPYTLGRKIGEGGMGEVFLAQHRLLKRPTAIKVLPPGEISSRAIERFEKEVQLTSQLTHPNTVAVYDFGHTDDGTFYFAMEYLHGLNLAEVIALGGPQPEARVIHVLLQACGSLHEAHERGLVHRDIKPGNIMLCERGGELDVVKVLDFGLAKDLKEHVSKPSFGALHGTPRYMAPERLINPQAVDARTDIFALGAVGYFLLVGEHAFSGSSPSSIHEGVRKETPPDPSERLRRPVSPGLTRVLMRCMAKSPSERPRTVDEVRSDLLAIDDVAAWTNEDAAAWWRSKREAKSRSTQT